MPTDGRMGQGKGQASPRNTRESRDDILLVNLPHTVSNQPPMPQLDSEFVKVAVVDSAAFGNWACTIAFISVLECLVPSVLS